MLFSRSQRFQHISEQVKKTSYRVGPGSYATPLSTNKGAGPKIIKESVIKDDLDYFYVGNVIVKQANVFRPSLIDKANYSFSGSIDRKNGLNRSVHTDSQEYSRDYKSVNMPNARNHTSEKIGARPRRSYLSADKQNKEINFLNGDYTPIYFLKNNSGEEQKRDEAIEYNEYISRKAGKITIPKQ